MSGIKKKLKEIVFADWKDLHGKERCLVLLIAAIAGAFSVRLTFFVGENMPYWVYQLYALCGILLTVWVFAFINHKRQRRAKDSVHNEPY